MKRYLIIFLLCFISFNFNVKAADKITVKLSKCVDGDTAHFIYKKEDITVRFLAIDTPESVHPTKGEEPYGKKASEYTCNRLTEATKIELEYDPNSDKTDKYNRHLAWIWVDGYLLQNEIIKEGLAEVTYLYGDYKYTPTLQDSEAIAKVNKIGIWSEDNIEEKEDSPNSLYDLLKDIIDTIFDSLTKIMNKIADFIKNIDIEG